MNGRVGLVIGIVGLVALAPVSGAALALRETSQTQKPREFAVKVTTDRLGSYPGLAWDTLDEAHERLISRGHFIRCARLTHGSEWHLRRVDFASARALSIHRRGISQTRGLQVWMEVRATSGGAPLADPYYVDVVRVGSKLRWLLDKSTEAQLRRNPAGCWQ
jgi:hypothetical protein